MERSICFGLFLVADVFYCERGSLNRCGRLNEQFVFRPADRSIDDGEMAIFIVVLKSIE